MGEDVFGSSQPTLNFALDTGQTADGLAQLTSRRQERHQRPGAESGENCGVEGKPHQHRQGECQQGLNDRGTERVCKCELQALCAVVGTGSFESLALMRLAVKQAHLFVGSDSLVRYLSHITHRRLYSTAIAPEMLTYNGDHQGDKWGHCEKHQAELPVQIQHVTDQCDDG